MRALLHLTMFPGWKDGKRFPGGSQGKKNRQEGGEMGEDSCRRGGGKSMIRVFPFSRYFKTPYNNILF
jgi:hypothetical protein